MRQQAEPGIARWAAPGLSTRSTSAFHTSSARRADLQITRRSSSRRRSKRCQLSKREDDGDEEEDSSDDEDDRNDEDDENDESKKSNAGTIAGGVIGGVVLIVLIFFLLFWFKLRPERRRRRRKREEEEEKKRKQTQDEESVTEHNTVGYLQQQQQQHQAMPAGPEPVYARGGVSPPFGSATTTPNGGRPVSPPVQPHGTAASPAELASPVFADGCEPSPAQLDHGKPSSSPPPRYSTAFSATELPSPVDGIPVANGREPSSLPSALQPDYGTKDSYIRTRVESSWPGFHPADQPNPGY
ncbi:hypothetical protein RRF57_010191 [Xylaria bambusicola]|uniref:Uncharacterized protein n=1 Tax=Xylaria bambusicola TaxID=326684 RepID=A0AAN7ZCQ7_9PEZI